MSLDPTSLDRLHDIVAPAPTPWWPPAPGWLLVLVLLLLIVLSFALRLLRHHQRNRYRREALAVLSAQQPLLRDSARRAEGVSAIAVVLKRTALSAWPRDQVAGLTGAPWLTFLDRSARLDGFAHGPGRLLATALYDPAAARSLDEAEARQLAALARRWIARHRPEDAPC